MTFLRSIEAERRRIELDLLAVAQRHRRKGEVGVREDVVDRRPGGRDDRGGGEQALLGVAQRVRAPALDVIEVVLIGLQPRLLRGPLVERRLVDLQDLGLDEGHLLAELGAHLLHLLLHPLVLRHARVLVRDQAGVQVDPLQLLRGRVGGVEGVGEPRG
jgi:hypothetical protein